MSEVQRVEKWDRYYTKSYSPVFDPNKAAPITGKEHEWVYRADNGYYDNAYVCRLCGKENWGWNLWKEDWEPRCGESASKKEDAT